MILTLCMYVCMYVGSPGLTTKDGYSAYTSLVEAFKEKNAGPYTSLVK